MLALVSLRHRNLRLRRLVENSLAIQDVDVGEEELGKIVKICPPFLLAHQLIVFLPERVIKVGNSVPKNVRNDISLVQFRLSAYSFGGCFHLCNVSEKLQMGFVIALFNSFAH